MKEFLQKIFYYILHSFTGCREKDLRFFKDKSAWCEKCGRTWFFFN